MHLFPFDQHNLSYNQSGKQDQHHLHVHRLMSLVLCMHLFMFNPKIIKQALSHWAIRFYRNKFSWHHNFKFKCKIFGSCFLSCYCLCCCCCCCCCCYLLFSIACISFILGCFLPQIQDLCCIVYLLVLHIHVYQSSKIISNYICAGIKQFKCCIHVPVGLAGP